MVCLIPVADGVVVGIDHSGLRIFRDTGHSFKCEVTGSQHGGLLIDERVVGIRFLRDLFYRGTAVERVDGDIATPLDCFLAIVGRKQIDLVYRLRLSEFFHRFLCLFRF